MLKGEGQSRLIGIDGDAKPEAVSPLAARSPNATQAGSTHGRAGDHCVVRSDRSGRPGGPAGAVTVAKAELQKAASSRRAKRPRCVRHRQSTTSVAGIRADQNRAVPDPGRRFHRSGLQGHDLRQRPDPDRNGDAFRLHPVGDPVPTNPVLPRVVASSPPNRRSPWPRARRQLSSSTPPAATPRSTAAPPRLRCNGRSSRAASPPG